MVFWGWAALLAAARSWAEVRARAGEGGARQAVALEQSPWLLHAVDAAHLEAAAAAGTGGAGDDDPAALRQVLEVRPRASEVWIRLGLLEERAGRIEDAERALLEAGRIDRQLAPAWTLANFYLRCGDRGRFWIWARRAAGRIYDGYRPLLRLADAFEPSPEALLERLGGGAPLTRAYLDFLIGEGRLHDAQRAAEDLIGYGDAGDNPRLANLVARHIAAGDAVAALAIWNRRFPALDPAEGRVLTNGGLTREPGGEGFDWQLPECAAVHASWRRGEMRFDLAAAGPAGNPGTGRSCVFFEQAIPVRPGARYRLRFSYVNSELDATGLRWTLGRAGAAELAPHDAWAPAEIVFAPGVSADPGLAHLALSYRAQGRPGAAGWVRLRDIFLEPLP